MEEFQTPEKKEKMGRRNRAAKIRLGFIPKQGLNAGPLIQLKFQL